MTREDFHSYWKGEHTKVVKQVAGPLGIRRNAHNRTLATELDDSIRRGRGAPPDDYDGVAESWFDRIEALSAATKTEEGLAAAQLLADDEERFIDFSRSRIFFVEEEVVI